MGLPASGKTTFLAALWHLIESDETDCRLRLESYEGDLVYLNLIAEAWRTFQKVPRTSQVGDVDVTIHLIDRQTGVKAAAFFPDLAGETFDTQVEARRCRPEFVEDVAQDNGILFFISANVKDDTLSLVELNAMLPPTSKNDEVLAAGEKPPLVEVEDSLTPAAEWEPKLLPAQVRVVQLLSDFLQAPFEPRQRRLAIMISAWDLTRGTELDPVGWLAAHMPLVDQFLRANTLSFQHRIYGVSAQGVSLEDDKAVSDAAKLTPSRRIQIVGPEGAGHDLTSPLLWLMSSG